MSSRSQRVATWWQALAVYRDRRVLAMVFLGFSSGLPFGVLAEPLSAWLAESGVSKTGIGLFALASLPYSLKLVIAPFLDRLPPPLWLVRFGRRRGWALCAQAALIATIAGLATTDPGNAAIWTAVFAVAIAFASACQDIVVDAYRIEILEERQLAAGAATFVLGWRVGQFGAGAGGLILADLLPWSTVMVIVGSGVVIGMIAIFLNPEPKASPDADASIAASASRLAKRWRRLPRQVIDALAWLDMAALGPLRDFFARPGWLAILLFILLYKLGDSVLSVMKIPFFLELGFTKTEIAEYVKAFGVFPLIGGGFLGGIALAKFGIHRGLLVCGLAMAVSNLIFVALANAGPDRAMLALAIAVENTTTGMGTTAFVAFLSSLCNQAYTATQYALLTSLMGFSRTTLAASAGWLADQMAWVPFFVLTTVAAVPGLILLVWITRRYPPPREGAAPTVSA